MAIKKNKAGILAAISAVATESNLPKESRNRAQPSLPKGTIGSIRAGLGGIQEIDTNLIIPWGPQDRLDTKLTAVNSKEMPASVENLAKSISESGQQIPVLLRPSSEQDGHFEVIYGRRRILACKQLGVPAKALIRTLDDKEALMAKGLENASRTELSFYERARFATAIISQGYERTTACQALSVSKNTLSQLERITRIIPDTVGDVIGSAPEAGRPKWMALAIVFENGETEETQCLTILGNCPADMTSDERLTHLTKEISAPNKKSIETLTRTPFEGVQIKSGKSSISLTVRRHGKHAAFADWLNQNLDGILQESFKRFQIQNNNSKTQK